jgi:phospholipase/carboxylesterase
MAQMSDLRLAGLKVHSNTSAISKSGGMTAAVVLLHGFGAPGTDLVSLADVLNVPEGTGLFFPEGPLDLGVQMGAGYAGGRAWWPIDMVQLQVAMFTGQIHAAAKGLASGLESARSQIAELLAELQSKFGLKPERIVLGGFSQGAVACLDLALASSSRFAGLILMSGTMVDPDSIEQLAPLKVGTRALLSHGRSDPMLPYSVAESLRDKLVAAEWDITWTSFPGGHGIPTEVVKSVSTALPRWLC